jgi:ankyrin repeat protein
MHVACERGYKHAIKLLLKHDVDTQARDGKGKTPLHYLACEPFSNS